MSIDYALLLSFIAFFGINAIIIFGFKKLSVNKSIIAMVCASLLLSIWPFGGVVMGQKHPTWIGTYLCDIKEANVPLGKAQFCAPDGYIAKDSAANYFPKDKGENINLTNKFGCWLPKDSKIALETWESKGWGITMGQFTKYVIVDSNENPAKQ